MSSLSTPTARSPRLTLVSLREPPAALAHRLKRTARCRVVWPWDQPPREAQRVRPGPALCIEILTIGRRDDRSVDDRRDAPRTRSSGRRRWLAKAGFPTLASIYVRAMAFRWFQRSRVERADIAEPIAEEAVPVPPETPDNLVLWMKSLGPTSLRRLETERTIAHLLAAVPVGELRRLDYDMRWRSSWRTHAWESMSPAGAAIAIRRSTDPVIAAAGFSMHRNGHIRELAVRSLTATRDRRANPWLFLRAGDWVEEVPTVLAPPFISKEARITSAPSSRMRSPRFSVRSRTLDTSSFERAAIRSAERSSTTTRFRSCLASARTAPRSFIRPGKSGSAQRSWSTPERPRQNRHCSQHEPGPSPPRPVKQRLESNAGSDCKPHRRRTRRPPSPGRNLRGNSNLRAEASPK